MSHTNEDPIHMPSRGEIETLCVLHAVGSSGCRANDLAARLGLSATLASVVAHGIERMVFGGLLDSVDDSFRLTERGRDLLMKRLDELGLR